MSVGSKRIWKAHLPIHFCLVPFGTDRAVEDAYSMGISLARLVGRNDGDNSLVR